MFKVTIRPNKVKKVRHTQSCWFLYSSRLSWCTVWKDRQNSICAHCNSLLPTIKNKTSIKTYRCRYTSL